MDELKAGDNPIERDSEVKNLGLLIEEKLTWESNTPKNIQKSYSKCKEFYQFRKLLSLKTKTMLVETYVLSQLNYCDM